MASVPVEETRFRKLSGPMGVVVRVLFIAMPVIGAIFVLDVPLYFELPIMREQYLGFFLGMALAGVFLVAPPTKRARVDRVPFYDAILAILGFGVGVYVAILYPSILEQLGVIEAPRVIVSTIAIVLVLEAVRRVTGWILLTIGLVFLLYASFAWLVPGPLSGKGVPWPQLSSYLLMDPNGMLGLPMAVAAVIVLAFILFGNVLFAIGGGAFLTDLSMAGLGQFRGGPAKMAIVASSLFGTISGSAVSNVATTGVMTIPLMKKSGFKPHMAGAVEAVASTGGQLMPPIMGAAAFLIAVFLGIPYQQVVIAAILPAILYYLALFVQVDLEAAKTGLRGLSRDQLPSIKGVIGQSYLFVIPLASLVYALFGLNFQPEKAAFLAVLVCIVLGFIRPETRLRVGWLFKALEGTGRTMLELTAIVALAGVVIGVIGRTGLGFTLSMSLVEMAGGSVLLLLFIVAVANIILGMGMPTTAVYILLAVLGAPAIIQMGIDPLAAHLFIFYYGMMSMITPPICFAAYAGAAIAGANYMRTGYTAMRLGIVAYVMPFLFVFSPALLLKGSPEEVLQAMFTAIAGAILLGVAVSGYMFRPLVLAKRLVIALAALGLFIPASGQFGAFGLYTDIFGGAIAVVMVAWEWRGGISRTQVA
ncbi:MAG: TRAP transporter fused permease subunit [Dehalococcoidia bacterium]|nr:TRAP transporter fused permease subunit [Dehalococcoidia bacterium]